ncbi:MAG: response regulator [Oligoflexales bacterium]|nr:response regulator [Oligoflexales bacterium]
MPKKILVVEDSQDTRRQLAKVLVSENYEVVEACDGEDGLSKLKGNSDVSLIISDLYMPLMNGLEMCQKIKTDAELRKIPILMLTTESSDELKARGKSVGVLAWIVKPFSARGIVNAVNLIATTKIKAGEKELPVFLDPEIAKNQSESGGTEDKVLQLERENRLLKEKLQASFLKEKVKKI